MDDPGQILSEAEFRMKKRKSGFYRKLSNISGYGGIVVKTFDTETANEGEEEDVEIIKNLKFYKKTRHYRQLQLADGDAGGSSGSEAGSCCSHEERPPGADGSGDGDGAKKKPEEPAEEAKATEVKKGGSGPAQLMGLIRVKNWVTRQSGALPAARAKADKEAADAEIPKDEKKAEKEEGPEDNEK